MTERAGIKLSSVTTGGNAEKAGLKAGDTLLAVNGIPVDSGFALSAALKETPQNGPYPVEFCRENGESETVEVQPGKLGAQTPPNATTSHQAKQAQEVQNATNQESKPKSFWAFLVMFVATIYLLISILMALGGLIGFGGGLALFAAVESIVISLFYYGIAHLLVSIWENSEIIKSNQGKT